MKQDLISLDVGPELSYSALFESLPGSCILLQNDAPKYTILAATPQYVAVIGTTKEYLIGKGMFEAFPPNPDDPTDTGTNDVKASFDHVRLQKEPHQLPVQRYDVAGPEGQLIERYWSAINKPVFSPDGNVAYIIHTAEDITALIKSKKREEEHQALQKAYKKIEERETALKQFKFMADQARDPFILMREDGTFAYLNKKALEAWDYTEEEAIHIRVPDVDPIYQDELFSAAFSRAQKEEIPTFESLHKRKDGHIFPVEVKMGGLMLNGKPHLFAIARDISERRMQEKAFETQNELIRTITDNATSTLFMMNAKGYCTFMNVAGEKMFGYTQEEIRSRPLHYLIHHHRPDGSFYPMEECPLDRALPENFDVRAHRDLFFRKDGSSFPISCAASPIFENGVPVATVIEVRDISLDVEAEQALRRSAAELEQLVQERTKNLLQVNEQLQQFTYAASHDLQEPLRKVTMFLDRLLSEIGPSLSEGNKRIAGRIEHTTGRMRGLIDDLLAYSNTTLGATNFEEISLSNIVKDVLDDMEASILQQAATINVQELPRVKGDARQLRQLFQNLISNSLKYRKVDAAPQVQITAQLVKGAEVEACIPQERKSTLFHQIQVTDNGIGFHSDNAERIFKLFQRLHGKVEYPGTGVGLAIVQKVVESHKGYICAEGKPGNGATFSVYLPAE